MKELIVSLHDVAPSKAELCRRWVEILNERNIHATMLVVPGRWNGSSLETSPQFVSWLREVESQGHEIAIHGLHHSIDKQYRTKWQRHFMGSLLARGCEEFWHLPKMEAHRRIRIAREILQSFGFQPTGFVAPGWLMSPETVKALRELELSYTTTHTRFIDLLGNREERIVSLSQRPNSLLTKSGIAVNHAATEILSKFKSPIRIAIHPNDLINPHVRNANIAMIDRLTRRGYRTLTYAAKHNSSSLLRNSGLATFSE